MIYINIYLKVLLAKELGVEIGEYVKFYDLIISWANYARQWRLQWDAIGRPGANPIKTSSVQIIL